MTRIEAAIASLPRTGWSTWGSTPGVAPANGWSARDRDPGDDARGVDVGVLVRDQRVGREGQPDRAEDERGDEQEDERLVGIDAFRARGDRAGDRGRACGGAMETIRECGGRSGKDAFRVGRGDGRGFGQREASVCWDRLLRCYPARSARRLR